MIFRSSSLIVYRKGRKNDFCRDIGTFLCTYLILITFIENRRSHRSEDSRRDHWRQIIKARVDLTLLFPFTCTSSSVVFASDRLYNFMTFLTLWYQSRTLCTKHWYKLRKLIRDPILSIEVYKYIGSVDVKVKGSEKDKFITAM